MQSYFSMDENVPKYISSLLNLEVIRYSACEYTALLSNPNLRNSEKITAWSRHTTDERETLTKLSGFRH